MGRLRAAGYGVPPSSSGGFSGPGDTLRRGEWLRGGAWALATGWVRLTAVAPATLTPSELPKPVRVAPGFPGPGRAGRGAGLVPARRTDELRATERWEHPTVQLRASCSFEDGARRGRAWASRAPRAPVSPAGPWRRIASRDDENGPERACWTLEVFTASPTRLIRRRDSQ